MTEGQTALTIGWIRSLASDVMERGTTGSGLVPCAKPRVLIVCTHLRPDRTKRRSRHYLQPIAGLHIASQIDQGQFHVRLYHEDWHGPYDTNNPERYELVFLTGLQADFDRMRQLSYHFQRKGAVVVAGGSICSLFPEFAAKFFNSICTGGVESAADVARDFLAGQVKPIYRSPQQQITDYEVDYELLAKNGINPIVHLVEASRGCNFRCSFCVIPAEGIRHTSYSLKAIAAAVNSAIKSSPLLSFRRWYPMIFFVDNNFSNDRIKMIEVADFLRRQPKVRAWGAMVTQDVLRDREVIRHLASAKCRALFTGLESLDQAWLRKFNKKQNLSRRGNIVDDILFAEVQGICVLYGYLFDPRSHTVAEMKAQIASFEAASQLPLPTYFSLIVPLVGTASFWIDVEGGELLPNLRLRDLDGETIAYSRLADSVPAVCQFVEDFSRRPWSLISRKRALLGTLKRIWNSLTFNPVQWYLIWSTNFRTFIWARSYACSRRAYLAGEDVLDPQYFEHPKGISFEDWKMYFEPILITDARGELCEWLQPYVPKQLQKPPSAAKMKPRRAKLPQPRDLSAKQNFRGDLLLK